MVEDLKENIMISDADKKSKFSIIMANYNNGHYIKKAIESVINQLFNDWEFIIIDDASTDDSLDVIETYLDDARIRLVRNERNLGTTKSLKLGIGLSRSEIIGILDSDDALVEDAIETMLSVYEEDEGVGVAISQMIVCDSSMNELLRTRMTDIHQKMPFLYNHGSTAFRTFKRSAYDKTAGLDETIKFAEDVDILYKLEEVAKLIRVNRPLYMYRQLSNSQSHETKKYHTSMRSCALAMYRAYLRRRKLLTANLPRLELLRWMIAASRWSLELNGRAQAISYALRAIRIDPFEKAVYRNLWHVAALVWPSVFVKETDSSERLSDGRDVSKRKFIPVHRFQSNVSNKLADRFECVPIVNGTGHAAFGADHDVLQSGEYIASFDLDVSALPFAEGAIFKLDIYENLSRKRVVAEKDIHRDALKKSRTYYEIKFSAQEGERVEFRVWWTEQCYMHFYGLYLQYCGP